jgi:hypothetical protein
MIKRCGAIVRIFRLPETTSPKNCRYRQRSGLVSLGFDGFLGLVTIDFRMVFELRHRSE